MFVRRGRGNALTERVEISEGSPTARIELLQLRAILDP